MTANYDRQDRFYQRAKAEGYRSRAVYKLEEILKKLPKLKRGSRVVELGAWPGGWLQLLAEAVGPEGRVVGVDLEPILGLDETVKTLELDLSESETIDAIATALDGPADMVFSDAAPKLTGIKDVDRASEEELYDAALAVAEQMLKPNGCLVVKGFPGPEADRMRKILRERFGHVSEFRPEAKRKTSKEFYWIAKPKPR